MRAIGVNAVRTGPIADAELLVLADSLGFQVFQDVGPTYMPARRIHEIMTDLERTVSDVAQRSASYPVATYIGLGEGLDTSDPRTCAALARLSEAARLRAPGIRTYYVTHFLEDDRCADAVDLRIADAFLSARLVEALDSGEGVEEFDGIGVGALGRGRDPDAAGGGLSDPASAQSQARYLETALGHLLKEDSTRRPAVFVYAWRDGPRESILDEEFALFTANGASPPAYQVVRGFYTGDETVFAFPSGKAPREHTTWASILCWLIIAGIAAAYAASPQLRQVALRYFAAHGFYREAVVEGRDVLPLINVLLLASLSLMIGLATALVCLIVVHTHTAHVLSAWMPDFVRAFVAGLVERPWLLVLFIACLHAFWYTFWTSGLSLGSRAGRVLLPAQTLMLTIWPQWPFILWGVLASTMPGSHVAGRIRIAVLVIVLVVATYASSSARTLADYHVAARVPWYVTLSLVPFSPVGLIVLGVLAAWVSYGPEATYFVHLILRQ